MLKKLILTATFAMLAISCGSKNSNPKDYWTLPKPTVNVWEKSESNSFRGLVLDGSDTESLKALGSLDYNSHLQFSGLTEDIRFDATTECTDSSSKKWVYSSNENNSASKRFKAPVSQKLYFYNYIPTEVLTKVDSQITCNFLFVAYNSINSEKIYRLNDIKIDTIQSNVIKIISKNKNDKQAPQSILSTNIKYADQPYSVVDYTNSDLSFLVENTIEDTLLTGPGSVKCEGQDNTFSINSQNGALLTSLETIFFDLRNNNEISFLKNCRVYAQIKPINNDNDIRFVWSEFFDVIFEKPQIKVDVIRAEYDISNTSYPYNKSKYLDTALKLFEVKIINNSNKSVKIYLPSEQKIEAVINPLIYNVQNRDFKFINTNLWDGLDIYELNQEFKTELRFMSGGNRVLELNLIPKSKASFNIEIDKNFSCNIEPHPYFYRITEQDPKAERGFRIKAIDLDSIQNRIKLEYQNKGKMDEYPLISTLNDLISTSNSEDKTNLLQFNNDRSTAIDTYFLRSGQDLIYPTATKQNPWPVTNLTFHAMRDSVTKEKEQPTPLLKISESNTNSNFCKQVY